MGVKGIHAPIPTHPRKNQSPIKALTPVNRRDHTLIEKIQYSPFVLVDVSVDHFADKTAPICG